MATATNTANDNAAAIACGAQADKTGLLRIVRTPEGAVAFDATGRAPGRGRYVCSTDCFAAACKRNKLDRALKATLGSDDYDRIAADIAAHARCEGNVEEWYMASMRVHELAKEFNMSSKDMLDKLHEMKITAKSHASMLAESDVEKVRQNLSPEIKGARGRAFRPRRPRQLAEERAEAKRQQAEAERARREAVEQERAAREAERAKRAEEGGSASRPAAAKPQAKKVTNNPCESLASQIESEKERVAREAAERKARARAAAMAKEVAKKQAVEEALRNRNSARARPISPQPPLPSARHRCSAPASQASTACSPRSSPRSSASRSRRPSSRPRRRCQQAAARRPQARQEGYAR